MEQVTTLKAQLKGWFPAPPGSNLAEGFTVNHPWDSFHTLWVQVNWDLVTRWVAALKVEAPCSHLEWRWVQTSEYKKAIVKRGFKKDWVLVDEWGSEAVWLCLTPWFAASAPGSLSLETDRCLVLPVAHLVNPFAKWTPKYGDTDSVFVTYDSDSEDSLEEIISSDFSRPNGLTVAQNKLVVADSGYHQIKVLDLDEPDRPFLTLGKRDEKGWKIGQPNHVAVYQHRFYVVDKFYHQIQVWTAASQQVGAWGSYGKQEGEFNEPYAIAIAEDQKLPKVLVTDKNNHRIQVFDLEGKFLYAWSNNLARPRGLAYASGLVYVANFNSDSVSVFTLDGSLVRQWKTKFKNLEFLTVYQDQVFVTDQNRISVYDLAGNFLKEWFSKAQFLTGVAVANQQIYVANWNDSCIHILEGIKLE